MPALSICADRVRTYDNDRFLSALFAPAEAREHLFALYAFNLELAKIRETVSEPLIGRMRLQFWRDAIPNIATGKPPAHEVAEPLAAAVAMGGLQVDELLTLIEAREADLDDEPPHDLAQLEDYAADTSATVVALALRILGVEPGEFDRGVRDAGIAVSLVGLVRAIPFHAATGHVTLPRDLCFRAGLDPSVPQQWPQNPDVSAITAPLLDAAAARLASARIAIRGLPKRGVSAFLPMSLAGLYLKDLRKHGGDPARHAARPLGAQRQLTVFWRSLMRRP